MTQIYIFIRRRNLINIQSWSDFPVNLPAIGFLSPAHSDTSPSVQLHWSWMMAARHHQPALTAHSAAFVLVHLSNRIHRDVSSGMRADINCRSPFQEENRGFPASVFISSLRWQTSVLRMPADRSVPISRKQTTMWCDNAYINTVSQCPVKVQRLSGMFVEDFPDLSESLHPSWKKNHG